MNNRRQGPRGGAGNTAPFVVLRCAALLAALMWVLPICTHTSAETSAEPSPPVAASVSAGGTTAGPPVLIGAVATVEADRTCPSNQHGPGDAHGRSTTWAAANTASPLPAPCPRAVDVSAAGPPGTSAARGAPPDLAHTPGIHQLQVQRI
ncbi:hypothetical protein [Streptomyces lincolnensis]|uniref:hypothetical protein n=1 Tax=Streptomyces lincolnensis TaxID=1915 RepID=UPI0008299D37|nr:hypothetical protein [Streptomyces lincolnensis]QMV10519.1 hypothetical protein GJU35_35890 [Streptomyces lincolnensis]